jgi:hypothetical protein
MILNRYPVEARSRASEATEEEEEHAVQQLGLFVLPGTDLMFPGSLLHLIVWEPRYLRLMERCVENNLPFGVQESAGARRGVTARIESVERMPTGNLVVRANAQHRYTVVGDVETEANSFGLYRCSASLLRDTPIPFAAGEATIPGSHPLCQSLPLATQAHLRACPNELQRCIAIKNVMADAMARMLGSLSSRQMHYLLQQYGPPPANDATPVHIERWSYYISAVLVMDDILKASCFYTLSIFERLLVCYSVLESMNAQHGGRDIAEGGDNNLAPLTHVPAAAAIYVTQSSAGMLLTLLSKPHQLVSHVVNNRVASAVLMLGLIVLLVWLAQRAPAGRDIYL